MYSIINDNNTMDDNDKPIPFERWLGDENGSSEYGVHDLLERLDRVGRVVDDVRDLLEGFGRGDYDDQQFIIVAEVIIGAFEDALYTRGMRLEDYDSPDEPGTDPEVPPSED